jgi:hypothetical protein
MHDLPRASFLIIADALLVMALAGCGTTTTRYRHGDFIMNIDSAPPSVAPATEATTQVADANAQPRA